MLGDSARNPVMTMRLTGCLVMSLILFSLCALPLLFVDLAHSALENLHLSPGMALLVLISMVIGSVVNIPIKRMPTPHEVVVPVFEPVSGWPVLPRYQRLRQEMVIAVNVGGCVIPVLLAIGLWRHIAAGGSTAMMATALGAIANIAVCYTLARPVPGLGIALPVFVPALVALSFAWLGLSDAEFADSRAPAAFVIGISGPLVGADLLHWRRFAHIGAGVVSIGGAGTWDGIVLSGLLAALLA